MSSVLFDLDETLYYGDLVAVADQLLRIEDKHPDPSKVYSGSSIKRIDMTDIPIEIKNKCQELFKDEKYAIHGKKVMPGCRYLLNYLDSFLGHDIGVITSRPRNLKGPTERVLEKDFVGTSFSLGIHFSNSKSSIDMAEIPSKLEIIKKIKPDFYFDDIIEYCNEAAEAGVENVYLVSNIHTGWNHNREKLNPIVNIIKNPVEVEF